MESDDLNQLKRSYAITLLNEATGGDLQYTEQLSSLETIHEDDLMRVLHQAKVPLAAILREDLVRVFQADEPRYFISSARIVELYRPRHGIHLPPQGDRRARIRHESQVLEALFVEKDKELTELENYGATLAEFRSGVACPTEQKFFYKTQEWNDRAKVVRVMDHSRCRKCERHVQDLDEELHVHHDEHIYSAYSDTFYRNFDSLRLRTLCKSCHDEFHVSHKRGFTHFVPASKLDREKDHRMRAAMAKVHDLLRECPFCFGASA